MDVKTEHRMVAVIQTAGILDDPNHHRRMATRDEINHPNFGLVLCQVAPQRGEPNKRMVNKLIQQPLDFRKSEWCKYKDALTSAINKKTLFAEDFDRQHVVW